LFSRTFRAIDFTKWSGAKTNEMRTALLIGLLSSLSWTAMSQDSQPFLKAMNEGNSTALSMLVDQQADFQIGENRQKVNRNQAEKMLETFFAPKSELRFLFRHQSNTNENNGTRYKIGMLNADNERYRVFVLFKMDSGDMSIAELAIESP